MLKLTEEESVFLKQLFRIRRDMEILAQEQDTHVDRLLTILRGHGAKMAEGKEGLTAERVKCDGYEAVIVRRDGRLPHDEV